MWSHHMAIGGNVVTPCGYRWQCGHTMWLWVEMWSHHVAIGGNVAQILTALSFKMIRHTQQSSKVTTSPAISQILGTMKNIFHTIFLLLLLLLERGYLWFSPGSGRRIHGTTGRWWRSMCTDRPLAPPPPRHSQTPCSQWCLRRRTWWVSATLWPRTWSCRLCHMTYMTKTFSQAQSGGVDRHLKCNNKVTKTALLCTGSAENFTSRNLVPSISDFKLTLTY